MSEWKDIAIKDLCELVVDCVNKTAPTTDSPTPYKMIRTTNVRNGWIDTEDVNYVDEATYHKWTRRAVPQRDDVILTREAPLGEVGLLRSDEYIFLGQRLMMYRADRTRSDPRFLLYALMDESVQAQLKAFGSGATVEHVRVPDCENLVIKAPCLETQRQIADMLGAIDDLVANNRLRIKLLEQMAETVYQEWITRFGESNDSVESERGSIPDGWRWTPLGGLCDQVTSSVMPEEVPKDTPSVGLEHLPRKSLTLREWGLAQEMTSRKLVFEKGDIFFGKIRPYFHKVTIAPVNGICSTDIIVLRPRRSVLSSLVALTAFSEEFVAHATQTANGTKMPRADWKVLREWPVAVPPEPLLKRFEDTARPTVAHCEALAASAKTASRIRDTLLPRLVQGRIDMSSVDLDALMLEAAG